MNAADNARHEGLTTEQIAAAGTGPAQDRRGTPAQAPDVQAEQPREDLPGDSGMIPAAVTSQDERLGAGPAGSLGEKDSLGLPGDGAASVAGEGSPAADAELRANLLGGDELQGIVARWTEIQAEFVDEPRTAVEQADALVAEFMQRLAEMFAHERAVLEQRWAGGNEVSTEELRQSLRRYRSFFERLLAA
jgi:hypothetical protein